MIRRRNIEKGYKSVLRGLEFETVFYTPLGRNSQPGSNMTEIEVFWSG